MNEQEQEDSQPRKRVRNRNRASRNGGGGNSKVPTELTKEPELVKLNTLDYDPKIFETLNTDTVVDEFFSNKGGIPRACNFILIGDPGVGKTTVALDWICNTRRDGAKALFISAEMNSIDMYEYMERYPKFGEIDILFLGDYTDENPKLVIERVLEKGYDLVLGDSFAEIQDEVKESCNETSSKVEKWLIDLMCRHNKGGNEDKLYTTFIMIQQMTKGGKFVGSNKLKHNTTGMCEIRFDGSSEAAPRYIEFSKNRRGSVNRRLYFLLDQTEDVNYLEDKWHMAEENRIKMKAEMEELAEEGNTFDELLNLDGDKKEEEESEEVINQDENETEEDKELVDGDAEHVDAQ